MDIRVWWLDNSDLYEAKRLVATVRSKQFTDWDYMKVEDGSFDDIERAKTYVCNELLTRSILAEGKIIHLLGIPSYHSELSELLEEIPTGVLLIIQASPNRTYSLWKKTQALAKKSMAKVTEFEELNKQNCVEWIKKRAESFLLTIDVVPAQMLSDFVGFDKTRIHSELAKLRDFLGPSGEVTPGVVQDVCYGHGQAIVYDLGKAILSGRSDVALEVLNRLFNRGEDAHKICGYLMDFFNKLSVSAAFDGNAEKIKPFASSLFKWQKDEDAEKKKRVILEGMFTIKSGKSVPMFGNVNSFYYSAKDYCASGWSKGKILGLVRQLGIMHTEIRMQRARPETLVRIFVASAAGGISSEKAI